MTLLYIGTAVTSPAPILLIGGADLRHLYHNSTLANAADIASEVVEQYVLSASRPTLVVMAPDDYWAWYLDHPRAGRWLSSVRDLISGLRGALGLGAYLVALLDAEFEMGLGGRPARLIRSCRMASVDDWAISRGTGLDFLAET